MKIVLIFSLIATIGIIPAYADSSIIFRETPGKDGCYDFNVKDWSLAEFKRSKYDIDEIIRTTSMDVNTLDALISKTLIKLSSLKSDISQQKVTVDKYPEKDLHKIKYNKLIN